ncbi:MAG: hypothetical protein IK142_02135 [Clostridiales bacterium]|nr:hypothetical protein [Clostridiales bacterium]
MKYCEHCGSASEDNIRFCSTCGAKFPEQEPEPVAAPVVDSPEVDPIYQPTFESSKAQDIVKIKAVDTSDNRLYNR